MARTQSVAQLKREVEKEMKAVAKMARDRLLEPTDTWTNKPEFRVSDPHVSAGDLISNVRTSGALEGDNEYFWLDEGTDVRYATMTRNFQPKTRVRSFTSSPGQGRLRYIDRMVPKPGIEAREWTKLASLEYDAILQSAIDKVLAGYSHKPSARAVGVRRFIP